MNLLQRLFGTPFKAFDRKKKVEPTVPCPKPQTFRHLACYQSDSIWYEESERRKRDDENRRRDSLDTCTTAILFNTPTDYSSSTNSDNSTSGFSEGFGGGDYSGGGSGGSWSDSSSSSSYDSGSGYDSGCCDSSSSSCD